MDHHFRGDMNSAYTGRKSYLPTMSGFGTHPRVTLPLVIFAILAVASGIFAVARPFIGA